MLSFERQGRTRSWFLKFLSNINRTLARKRGVYIRAPRGPAARDRGERGGSFRAWRTSRHDHRQMTYFISFDLDLR